MYSRMSVALVALFALATALPASEQTALPAELLETIESFYASIEHADVETRIDLLADDVLLMPNLWTALRGKEEAAASFRRSAEAVFQLRERTMERLEVSGDLAYTVNAYDYTYHAQGDAPQWHRTKNVHIWRRGDDGRWRLAVDIWNSDVARDEFANE